MSIKTEGSPIYLTVLHQRGRLAASLTDLRLLARLETIEIAETLLFDLKQQSERCLSSHRSPDSSGSPSPAPSQLRELVRQLLGHLLPEGIAAFLRDAPESALALQLDASLLWVPWEFLWDGEF